MSSDTAQTVNLDAFTGKDRLRIAISGDVNLGEVKRAEGGVTMALIDPVLSVECDGVDFSALHPDILALIGVLAFHPALPEGAFDLRTGFPVSPNVETALRRPWILPKVRVIGNGTAEPYKPKMESVISYGGGLDSLAASILFPDVPLVHESPLPTSKAKFTDIVNPIVAKGAKNKIVFDNLRQLFTAWGLPLWVSVYVAALILEPRNIISGSEMTGTYLMGGVKYKPRNANLWYRVFKVVGINVLPTSFLSEIGNAKLVAAHGRMDDAAYCTKIDTKDCDKCTKCLRRRVIRASLDPRDIALVREFQQSERIAAFLASRPLYYGDVFTHAVASTQGQTWVNRHIQDLLDRHGKLSFHNAYYPDTFDHFEYPTELRAAAEAGMLAVGLQPFDGGTRERFGNYSQV